MTPAALVEAEAQRNQLAVELAAVASLTGRIEPELVRRLRLDFVRAAPASVEADLWLGPLVSARSADTIVLTPALLPVLRGRVPRDRLAAAAAAIADVHRDAPPLVQLEDALIADLLLGKPDDIIEQHLRGVLGSLAADPTRRRSLVAWAWTAIPRLPLGDRNLPLAGALTVAAGLAMRTPMSMNLAGARGALAAVPSDLFTGDVDLEVRRHDRWLLLSHATAATPPHRRITVPDTSPRFVELESGGKVQLVAIPKGSSADPIHLDSDTVILRCLGGRAWTLVARAPVPAPAPAPVVQRIARLVVAADGTAVEHDALDAGDLILVAGVDRTKPQWPDTVLALPSSKFPRFRPASEGESAVEADPDELAEAVLSLRGQQFEDVVDAFEGAQGLVDDRRLVVEPLSIPACFQATFTAGKRTVGIIGLNSWYLSPELVGEPTPDVDDRLLPADIDDWCARHDVTVLLLGVAPERLRPTRRVHLRHAITRRGRFDLVLGPLTEPRAREQWLNGGHIEIPVNPGDRHLLIELVDDDGRLHVEVHPRRQGPDVGIVDDDSYGPMGVDGSTHMLRHFRRNRALPPLSSTAKELIAYAGDMSNVLVWGPPDAAFDDLRDVLSQHLERAGHSVLTDEEISTLPSVDKEISTLPSADPVRIPRPICFEAYELQHIPRGIPTYTFLTGIAPENPEELALRMSARLVTATDWTIAEALARSFPDTEPSAINDVGGAPALVLLLNERVGKVPPEARDLYRTDDLEVLTAWRTLLDGGEPRLPQRLLVGSGLFRNEFGAAIIARSPWHQRTLDHAWLDEQFDRLFDTEDAARWVYIHGRSSFAGQLASALGRNGSYGLVVLDEDPLLAAHFVKALPPHLPRTQRIKQLVRSGGGRTLFGATTRAIATWPDGALPGEVDAVLLADREGDDDVIERVARRSRTPLWRWDQNKGDLIARAMKFLSGSVVRRDVPPSESQEIAALFVPADPGANPIVLGTTMMEIGAELERDGVRDRFIFISTQLLEPQWPAASVVHLLGPLGSDDSFGEIVEGIRNVASSVELVMLHGCYSDDLVRELSMWVQHVTGTRNRDAAALAFALGLYKGIAHNLPIPLAFEAARAEIRLAGILDSELPELSTRVSSRPK